MLGNHPPAKLLHPAAAAVLPLSDYEYTSQMMSFAYDRHLPSGMTWRDLFDMVSRGQRCGVCVGGERAAAARHLRSLQLALVVPGSL